MNILEEHLKKYSSYSETELNRLVLMVLDIETLFTLICKEEDADSKHIYFFLFKLLRKSMINPNVNNADTREENCVEAYLGKPPFEEPPIVRAILNFLFCKYGKSSDSELQNMYETTKLFLYCLNFWKFETPTSFIRRQSSTGKFRLSSSVVSNTSGKATANNSKLSLATEDANSNDQLSTNAKNEINALQQKIISLYKLNYTRWMCYNYVPSFCDSLERHETVNIFGITFLKLIYSSVRHELQEKLLSDKERISVEKRSILFNYLPKLLNSLEEELNDDNSQIWSQSSNHSNSITIYETEIHSNLSIILLIHSLF
jgi:histone acetyltransferase